MKMMFSGNRVRAGGIYVQIGMIAHTDKNGSHEGMKEEVIKTVSIEPTDP